GCKVMYTDACVGRPARCRGVDCEEFAGDGESRSMTDASVRNNRDVQNPAYRPAAFFSMSRDRGVF
ncbi:MAG: hypothetical protein LBL33_08510, partial [Tannerella sp.]|nr:hypothetical protein [Tannerella sp.]